MAENDGTKPELKLFDNPLDSFRNGVCLDMRVRFAMDLLTHSQIFLAFETDLEKSRARAHAAFALDVASELFDLAQEKGLLRPLDSPEAVQEMLAHFRRQVDANIAIGKEQKAAADGAVMLSRAVSSALKSAN